MGRSKIIFLALLPQFLPTGCLLRCAWQLFYQMGQSQYDFRLRDMPMAIYLQFSFVCSEKYVASPTVESVQKIKGFEGSKQRF